MRTGRLSWVRSRQVEWDRWKYANDKIIARDTRIALDSSRPMMNCERECTFHIGRWREVIMQHRVLEYTPQNLGLNEVEKGRPE